jgi:ribosomal protein S16
MRSIFLERGSKVDEGLAGRFIREIGIYPPGALVRLENNEIAIVVRRGSQAGKPKVRCLVDRYGKTEVSRPERDTSQPGFGISESLSHERFVGVVQGVERLWE